MVRQVGAHPARALSETGTAPAGASRSGAEVRATWPDRFRRFGTGTRLSPRRRCLVDIGVVAAAEGRRCGKGEGRAHPGRHPHHGAAGAVGDVPVGGSRGPVDATVRHDLLFAASQLDATAKAISKTRYPSSTSSNGSWSLSDAGSWTSGFFPGALWRIYEGTGASLWLTRATDWQAGVEGQKNDTSSHDVGFKIFTSFGNGARLTGTDAYRQVVLAGASSLASRYSSTVGAIKSWDGPTSSDFRVIIDNMMNLEILFWASKHGGQSAWYDMAVSHALKTMTNHVRADGSTYQGVNYNPSTGAVKAKFTHQGEAVESTWSRGQAWAVYGFTMVYRETGDSRFLDTARRVRRLLHRPPSGRSRAVLGLRGLGDPNEPRTAPPPRPQHPACSNSPGLRPTPAVRADTRRPRRTRSSPCRRAPTSPRGRTQPGDPAPRHAERTRWRLGHRVDLRRLLLHRGTPSVPVAGGDDHGCGDGHPVVGATVTFDAGSALSRADGRYLLRRDRGR